MRLQSIQGLRPLLLALATAAGLALYSGCGDEDAQASPPVEDAVHVHADQLIDEGRETFRFETFGDETFWGDTINLHQALAGVRQRRGRPRRQSRYRPSVGLKVDSRGAAKRRAGQDQERDRRPRRSRDDAGIAQAEGRRRRHRVFRPERDLDVDGHPMCPVSFDGRRLVRAGHRQAARRLGKSRSERRRHRGAGARPVRRWPSLLGVDEDTVRAVLGAWGPGKFDAELLLDGKGFRPDGESSAVLIPPAFGLAGVNLAHVDRLWVGYVLERLCRQYRNARPRGRFPMRVSLTPRDSPSRPQAGFDNIQSDAGQHQRQACRAPLLSTRPSRAAAAAWELRCTSRGARGGGFQRAGRSARAATSLRCTPSPAGIRTPERKSASTTSRPVASPDQRYRTAPLKGLWTHTKSGFFHDGRFPTLAAVVDHYDSSFGLGLTSSEKSDLIEYLKSL